MLSSNAFLEKCTFFSLTVKGPPDNNVAGKHRILTTINISGGRVIPTVTVTVLCLPLHRTDIYRSSQNYLETEGRICFKSENCIGEHGHHLGCYQSAE